MSEQLRHNCGLCVTHSLKDAYSLIESLQHRGREATGIVAIGHKKIDVIKWKGPINTFDIIDLYKIFPGSKYHTFMSHVRYATRGRKDKILEDAHPHVIGGKIEDRGNHIIISDCEMAAVHNGQINNEYLQEIDQTKLGTGCDTEAFLHLIRKKGEHQILKEIPGAYTIAIADKNRDEIVVLRDRTGIKPGVLGLKDGKYIVASEDVAFKNNGGEFIEDLIPGYAYYLYPDGSFKKEKVVDSNHKYCFFEVNYLSHIDSILNGISTRRFREVVGKNFGEEYKPYADFVTYLPRCPEVAARRYAEECDIEFLPVFYKMRGERAFQGSNLEDRKKSIEQNLNILPNVKQKIKGKTIIVIDDSIIRGNNSKWALYLLYETAKVEKVYYLSYTPPIGIIGNDNIPRGCMFGVDMPPNDNFIAREDINQKNKTLEEITNEMKIDEKMKMEVKYISVDGMLSAFEKLGMPSKDLCTYCIGGKHPFEN